GVAHRGEALVNHRERAGHGKGEDAFSRDSSGAQGARKKPTPVHNCGRGSSWNARGAPSAGLSLVGLPPLPVPEKLQRMPDLATFMVGQSLEAFFRLDIGLARRVWRLDEVDRLDAEITAEL